MVTFDGDSQTWRNQDTNEDIVSYVRSAVPAKRIYNIATSGYTLVEMDTLHVDEREPTLLHANKHALVAWGGTNDLFELATGATTYSRLVTYCNNRRADGWENIVVLNLIPQDKAGAPAGYETQRQAFNSLLAAGWPDICDAMVDIAADPRLQDPHNTTYFDPDQLHLLPAGHAVVAELVEPVLLDLGVSDSWPSAASVRSAVTYTVEGMPFAVSLT